MTHITIPEDRRRRLDTQVIAGIEFVDGEADAELGANTRSYFERFGFGLQETAVVAGEPTTLDELSRAQLLTEADRRGITISRRNASKADVRAELEAALAAPAEVEYADGREVEHGEDGIPVLRAAEPEVVHTTGQNDDDLSAEHLASADTV
jgi:hypothetical protein